jgi:phosphoribosylglycinamide formyltransferase-1
MFGHRVHKAVLDSGEKITGATVHLVDSEYDRGRIITQSKVEVLQNDSVGSLSTRVLNREHSLLVDTIERIISGKTDLHSIADGKQAKIYI